MACHMTRILDWCRHERLEQWVQVECLLMRMGLEALPWCQTNLPSQVLDHPRVGETWQTAQKAFCDHSVVPTPSPLTPVIGNPAFSPGLSDPRFQDLKEVGRSQLRHFISNGKWMSRENIMEDPLLGVLSFWQKLQLANFIGSQSSPTPFSRTLTTFELLCSEQELVRRMVLLAYQLLIAPPRGPNPPIFLSGNEIWGLR